MIVVMMGVSGCGKTTVGSMKANMLESQFSSLEEPDDAIEMDINNSPQDIVERIERQLFDVGKSY